MKTVGEVRFEKLNTGNFANCTETEFKQLDVKVSCIVLVFKTPSPKFSLYDKEFPDNPDFRILPTPLRLKFLI